MDVRTRIENMSSEFTATERRLSALLLMDYPFAGLLPIQELADNTKTSPPTVSRFVTKLGFSGFQEFQRQLIEELKPAPQCRAPFWLGFLTGPRAFWKQQKPRSQRSNLKRFANC